MAVVAFEAVRNLIPGMLERLALKRHLSELLAIALGQNDMALSAIAKHDFLFPICGLMFVIVATGATRPIFVPNIFRIASPARIHVREEVVAIDLLHGRNGMWDARVAGIFRNQLSGDLGEPARHREFRRFLALLPEVAYLNECLAIGVALLKWLCITVMRHCRLGQDGSVRCDLFGGRHLAQQHPAVLAIERNLLGRKLVIAFK